MSESFCALLLQFYPKISEYEELQSTYVANCVFNSFLCHTAIMLNNVTIYALRRTASLPKTLKHCFWVLLFLMLVLGNWVNHCTSHSWSCGYNKSTLAVIHTRVFSYRLGFVFSCFVLWCCRCKCRQVLSYSSSSQIPRTRDSQACCCCGDLNMGVECISFFDDFVGSLRC